MPELPEVETIRNQLEKLIVGKEILKVDIGLANMVKLPLDKFRKIVIGSKIKKVGRRAKILIFKLSNGWSELVHLKMSGRLIFRPREAKLQIQDTKWNHLTYYFKDGSRLFHNDMRQFGYVKLVKTDELTDFFKKEKLGPEPLERDFTFDNFLAILKRKPKAKIKQFLMDQQNIAGIGNIYSDEILFVAKIHPLKKAEKLGDKELRAVFEATKKVLKKAIKLCGTSTSDYRDTAGKAGRYTETRLVYQREGERCPNKCGGIIKRLKINGRSAHFCPYCQIYA